uniref:Uncharacterized protein n=1 Tax=Arundo donax TaxID=35708 RepID=A0A0A9A902_ARUDO
MSSTPGTVIME